MKDVARQAQVSVATVSLVINDAPGIAQSTREHVRTVIRALDYTPNAQARRFFTGKTNTVGLVMPPWPEAFADPYFIQLMLGALEAVRDRGYQLLLEVSDQRFVDHKLWNDLFAEKRVDGLLIATPYLDQGYLSELAHQHHPILLINGERPDLPHMDFIGYDDVRCGEDATNYLIGLGHTRIAHLAGQLNQASAVQRLQGYKNAMAKAGLAVLEHDVDVGQFLPLEARDALDRLWNQPEELRPTAIFCANDTMALSAINHFKELGVKVPGQVSVVGVDDTGAAELSDPPLTTFRQDIFSLARRASTLFLEKLENTGDQGPIRDRPAMAFVERSSCAPPARQAPKA